MSGATAKTGRFGRSPPTYPEGRHILLDAIDASPYIGERIAVEHLSLLPDFQAATHEC